MKVIRQRDIDAFSERVTPYLLQHEAENNLLFGIMNGIKTGVYPDNPCMASVQNDSGKIVAVAVRTPPHGVVLSRVTDHAAIPCLIESLSEIYDHIPTVLGETVLATQFAVNWHQAHQLKMHQGVYKLTQVTLPENVPGEYCVPTAADRDLIIDWQQAMAQESMSDSRSREDIAKVVDRRFAPGTQHEGYRLWWDDGHPVSMAAFTGPTPNGIRINCVYTPPDYRRRGYASAVTASLSQELLDKGYQFCFLFTDMSNPTSNHIYQVMGYEQVSEQYFYAFEE